MRRVLIVHAESGARAALRARLEASGHAVMEASDGATGWDAFGREQPGLVALSPDLPDSAGLRLFERIRTAAPKTPILLFAESGKEAAFGTRTLRAEEVARTAARIEERDASGPGPFASERPRILLVDDDPGIRSALQRFLTVRGYETEVAADGLAALAALGRRPPDLVLLDVDMPGLDGFRTLARLRAIGLSVDVLMLTGDDSLATMERCRDFGATDYLLKPFDFQYLDFSIYSYVLAGSLRIQD